MSASSSEFLTFYRRAVASGPSSLRLAARTLPRRPQPARAITYSAIRSDIGSEKKHATDKPERKDVQSAASGGAKDAKARGEGGNATSQSGKQATDKAKDEHPEAPDAAIGFQDERASKGP